MNDVWNADEFSLFYQIAPNKTIGLGPIEGKKKQKLRLSVLACCNTDGTEKMPLMLIGKSKRPRVFGNSAGKQLGFDYHANAKAWMTAELFNDWVIAFDELIGKHENEKLSCF